MSSNELVLRRPYLPRVPGLRHWLASAVLATTAALYLIAGLSVSWLEPASATPNARLGNSVRGIPGLGIPPQPEPLQFREIAPQDAVAINASVPVSTLPNPAARPFATAFATPADRLRAVECLTAAVYYEAAVETTAGQQAVAQVVLNRVRHPAYPRTVCGVVFQGHERATGCQFTFTCDGALRRTPSASGWARARRVAEEALAGKVFAPVGWATHYHTNWVVPYWSSSLVKLGNVGTHIFYRWEGGWGKPAAFRFGPGRVEPQIAKMRSLTSDPTSLADAPTVDDAAALAAAEAAAAAAAAGTAPQAPGSIDSFARAVLRRYEPPSAEASTAAVQARSTKPLSASTHWALSGLPAKPEAGAAAAAKPGAPAAAKPAAPAAAETAPKCLEGVRRVLSGKAVSEKTPGC
ncbi:MAG TPA: cell wall hydrolase [Allosphingosinicella sp.]|jgi:spore germination cell wall hydrolase CwlJ-like protein|nr:cell wall hydrolase [Allosphingosinicella sp.]